MKVGQSQYMKGCNTKPKEQVLYDGILYGCIGNFNSYKAYFNGKSKIFVCFLDELPCESRWVRNPSLLLDVHWEGDGGVFYSPRISTHWGKLLFIFESFSTNILNKNIFACGNTKQFIIHHQHWIKTKITRVANATAQRNFITFGNA